MKYFSDLTRQRMSEAAKRRCDDEWRKRQSEIKATALDTDKVKTLYESGMTQAEIAAELGVTQKVIWRHMKNHGIGARVAAKRDQCGAINHMWKGGSASYKAYGNGLALPCAYDVMQRIARFVEREAASNEA